MRPPSPVFWRLAALLATLGCACEPRADLPSPLPASEAAAPSADAAPPPVAAPPPEGRSVLPARVRPTAAEAPLVACASHAPVCVHAGPAVAPGAIARTLRAAATFLRTLAALGLPQPLPDGLLGGDARFDVYLLEGASAPATTTDGIPTGAGGDRGSAFAVLPPPPAWAGCDADAAVGRALAHAVILRFDAGAEAGSVAIAASHLASTVFDCGVADAAAIDAFQRAPERALASGSLDAPEGAMLFARMLDDDYGTGLPGGVILGLLAVSGQRTPADALRFANEPDLFDALRDNARERRTTLEDLLLDFAVDRAFVGSRSDGVHLSDVARFGAFGRVRFEWSVPFASLPRRLAPLRPIEPTGATYLWLDLAGAPADEVTFVADWEAGVLFHWALVKVDRAGAEAGRVAVAGIYGSTHAERTIVGLRDLAGLLVVGVNAGSIDRSHPYDPDEPPEAPRSYTVTFAQ